MENRPPDSGLELVLDNRKLIVAFVVLLAVCGCFFILGFVEGKRQGVQEATRNTAAAIPGGQSEMRTPGGEPDKKQPDDRASKEPLDWYKSVSSRNQVPKTLAKPPAPPPKASPSKAPGQETAAKTQSNPASAAKTVYSVQVGVFKNRDTVDAEAKRLKSKGFDNYIERLESGSYSLRVGRFDTRGEAVAMGHRLKAAGFATLIKAK